MTRARGFTLIESVIVIVVIGFAMITITQFLVPQITRSANPHYQVRAAALSQSVMSMVLARGFDEYSNFAGGELRCGEGAAVGTSHQFCSGMDASVNGLGPDGEVIAAYNDVDDYIGCWEPNGANGCRDLNVLVGDGVGNTTYQNFRLDIQVTYQEPSLIKQIVLTVSALNQTPIELRAYKGNY
ncbi:MULTISPECIES: prepilin-type N-terminal cleavage/methylation domain-containing protein [Vibrio]|uniref:MSHA biogenesis protein MshD n=2 Tax=Vibrio TaxID=662 RepID=A0A0A5HUK6_PHOS4|nr:MULTISPECIES: prepilin-type N-terminal cleavage/methylation domain-containing protein [Vibrio]KGY07975.1 MSHA biogenesis protein MshD [Vibrio sinaloensis]KHD23757.1 MSHA biogenesis protein MshD [Vibrio caribbeanicus]KIE20763.1 MSHA biogenesis protein MshD [Vibrio sinaloensis]